LISGFTTAGTPSQRERLESGTDLLTLAALLGQANLRMVQRYAHPSEDRKADAIRQMQKTRQKQSDSAKGKR
jgi:hypothetical protein